jgi:pSer/pThr/pTyr-binding forkhead associated (FHA) protein
MPARLVALNGTSDILLSALLTVVGRHQGCDSRLNSSRVSRRHCCLALCDGELLVRDLGSINGTRINGRKVDDGVLRPGDVLGVAHLRFRLILTDPAGSSHPGDTPREPEPDPTTLAREMAQDTALHDEMPSGDEAPHAARPDGA